MHVQETQPWIPNFFIISLFILAQSVITKNKGFVLKLCIISKDIEEKCSIQQNINLPFLNYLSCELFMPGVLISKRVSLNFTYCLKCSVQEQ